MESESSERIVVYIPFETLLGESAATVIKASLSEGIDLEPVADIEDIRPFSDRFYPLPEFLLAIFAERDLQGELKASKENGPLYPSHPGRWLSSDEEDRVDEAMRTAISANIPILIILVKNIELASGADVRNVAPVAKQYVIGTANNIVVVGADNVDEFPRALHEGIEKIKTIPSSRTDDPGRTESVPQSSLSDTAAKRDLLGFEPYVEAIKQFLTNDRTKGPLAMSIEGEWGSGKSSFMLQLLERLKENGAKTVWFNAWRHDKEEALWAAFTLGFINQLSRQQPWYVSLRSSFRLLWKRFDWRKGWFAVLRAIITIGVAIGVGVLIWKQGIKPFAVDGKEVKGVGDALAILLGSVGGLSFVWGFYRAIRKTIQIVPLRFDLKKHVKSEDYAGRISFIERFHKDFSKVIEAYVGKEKVYIFVDDLDRCEVPKAAELMQAMNLMIGESEQLIFIIGMDREKVAAGLAVKYEDLLPYLSGKSDEEFEGAKGRIGTEFGYAFIEKFVQLPCRVPVAGEKELKKFLDELSSEATGAASQTATKRRGFRFGFRGRSIEIERKSVKTKETIKAQVENNDQTVPPETKNVENDPATQPERNWSEFVLENGNDSTSVKDAVLLVADVFDHNPRRIKQFLNAFRLKAYIAYNTGLLNSGTDAERNALDSLLNREVWPERKNAITIEQLAKFVALGLRWPLLLADLEASPYLLKLLSKYAESAISEGEMEDHLKEDKSISVEERQWRKEWKLLSLLAAKASLPIDSDGQWYDDKEYEKYTMTKLNAKWLLEVSPKVIPQRSSTVAREDAIAEVSTLEIVAE